MTAVFRFEKPVPPCRVVVSLCGGGVCVYVSVGVGVGVGVCVCGPYRYLLMMLTGRSLLSCGGVPR